VEKAYLALQADGVVVRDRRRRLLISPPVAASAEFRRDWDDRLRPFLAEGLARGLVKLEIGRRVGELLAEVPDSAPDGDSG
jgi:DNA-binding transcriptional regulator YhcF (GntR family)